MSKNVGFSTVFSKFLDFRPNFYCTKPPNSNSVNDFASLDTSGGPGGVKIVVICI